MKMTIKKNCLTLVIAIIMGIILLNGSFVNAELTDKPSPNLWLSHFVGDEVIVVFISPPPDMTKSIKAKLMDAECSGIVLKLGNDEIFFSYANIISVEPISN
ncbi:MAG: hypothetical protein PVG39_18735 [Desulfobacteraceae bacterium]|jgi:hypothetical protein